MPSSEDDPNPRCFNCNEPVPRGSFCFGCKEFVCDECDVNHDVWGGHSPEAHLEEPEDEEW